MRELIVDLFSTVDGYTGPGPRSAPYWGYGAPGLQGWIDAQLAEEHVMLMGANTYRQMAEVVAAGHMPDPQMKRLPKIVFSKTIKPPLSWANSTVIDEPLETAVPALKASGDDLPMRTIGSPSLVRSLFRLGLADRLRVVVFPMIHGAEGDAPAFTGLPVLDLSLVGSTVLDERLVLLDYRVGGEDLSAGKADGS
jgi:dihydrofolate reductase